MLATGEASAKQERGEQPLVSCGEFSVQLVPLAIFGAVFT